MTDDRVEDFIESLWEGRLVDLDRLEELARRGATRALSPEALAGELIERRILTPYQAAQCLAGKGESLRLGPYRFLDLLGEGALGRVYRARHETTGRVVALKVAHPERLADADAVHRFHREAESARRLAHPNLVAVHDDGVQDGRHYLVMEYVEGIALDRFLDRNGPLDLPLACRFARQAALALQAMMDRRVVPSDVRPSDLIVREGPGRASVKLLAADQGRLGASARDLGQFEIGSLLDLSFDPPEDVLACAERALRQDARSALRGLGHVLLGMLAGPRDPALDRLLARMLGEGPEEPYETPGECARALALFCSPEPGPEPEFEPTIPEPAPAIDPPEPELPIEPSADRAGPLAMLPAVPSPNVVAAWPRRRTRPSAMFVLGALLGSALTALAPGWLRPSPTPTPAPTPPPLRSIAPPPLALAPRLEPPGPIGPPTPPAPVAPAIEPAAEVVEKPVAEVVEKPVLIAAPAEDEYSRLLALGDQELRNNRVDEAIARYGEAIERNPDLAPAYTRRANGLTRKERFREVVADGNKALAINPRDADAYRLRGAALVSLGDAGGAIADADRAIDLNPRDAHSLNTRGVAHFLQGRRTAAVRDLTEAVRIDDTLAVPQGNLAWILATASEPTLRNSPMAVSYATNACLLTRWSDPLQLKILAASHGACGAFDQAVHYQELALRSAWNLPRQVVDQYQAQLTQYRAKLSGREARNLPRGLGLAAHLLSGRPATPPPPPVPALSPRPLPPPPPVPVYRPAPKPRPRAVLTRPIRSTLPA